MNRNNPRTGNNPRPRRWQVEYVPLYCSRPTQTQDEDSYESDSSDFPPIRIGKSMSPASAMRRNRFPDEEPPQPRHHKGLGETNILNIVDASHALATASAPVQHRKPEVSNSLHSLQVTRLILNVNARGSIRLRLLIRRRPCQSEPLESKTTTGTH